MGISVDSIEANADFARKIGVTFPLLSDTSKQVSTDYGVLNRLFRWANRTTFVVDKQGMIQHIEAGGSAVDPTGAVTMCSRLQAKKAPIQQQP